MEGQLVVGTGQGGLHELLVPGTHKSPEMDQVAAMFFPASFLLITSHMLELRGMFSCASLLPGSSEEQTSQFRALEQPSLGSRPAVPLAAL